MNFKKPAPPPELDTAADSERKAARQVDAAEPGPPLCADCGEVCGMVGFVRICLSCAAIQLAPRNGDFPTEQE